MAKYHINSKGNPAQCRATQKACPLGGEHFDSLAEASEYQEAEALREFTQMAEQPSPAAKAEATPVGEHFDSATDAMENQHGRSQAQVAAPESTGAEIFIRHQGEQVSLLELSESDIPQERCAAAGSSQAPEAMLRKLAVDFLPEVRENVARNKKTPTDLLPGLAESDGVARIMVATRADASPELLAKLGDRDEFDTWRQAQNRKAVAGAVEGEGLLRRAADESILRETVQALADNPTTPPSTLAKIARGDFLVSEDMWYRSREYVPIALAVRNPNTPLEAIAEAGWHEDEYVRQAVLDSPRSSESPGLREMLILRGGRARN